MGPLPRALYDQPEPDLGLSLPRGALGRETIAAVTSGVLIVDDDPGFRALARRILTDAGFLVLGEAETVADALATIAAVEPAAVLLDVGLPDGDGITLAAQLATLPARPAVLLTSTDPDAVSAADLLRCGARAFVPKADLPGATLEELRATR
jgi:DNA-binding NarL/FixJ family response regulator